MHGGEEALENSWVAVFTILRSRKVCAFLPHLGSISVSLTPCSDPGEFKDEVSDLGAWERPAGEGPLDSETGRRECLRGDCLGKTDVRTTKVHGKEVTHVDCPAHIPHPQDNGTELIPRD